MDLRALTSRVSNPRALDWLIAGTLAVLAQLEVWLGGGWGGPRGVAAVTALLVTLAFGLRRRAPLAVLGIALAGSTVSFAYAPASGSQDSFVLLVVLLVVCYSTGAHAAGRAAVVGGLGVAALAAVITLTDSDEITLSGVGFFALLMGVPWAAGVGIRRRRASEGRLELHTRVLERDREQNAREAVAEERARIARELHDVVAHGVSVMTLQAQGGARVLDSEPDEARQAFAAIEQTGRRSLVEMRRLLGMLRTSDDELPLAPQPSLAQLDALVEQVRAAGLPVELVREGELAALPPGVDLSAFRIVQEALTNALKHAGPTQVEVVVRYGKRDLELEVADSGVGGPPDPENGGHGLIGMRERVSVFGGDLEAGERPEGGYLVRVRLPLSMERP